MNTISTMLATVGGLSAVANGGRLPDLTGFSCLCCAYRSTVLWWVT